MVAVGTFFLGLIVGALIGAGILWYLATQTNALKKCPTKKEIEKQVEEAKAAQKKADNAAEAERRKKEEEDRAKNKPNNNGGNNGTQPNSFGW